MSQKSSLAALVPLVSVVILLFASTAESCVNFLAWWSPPGGSNLINAELWDNTNANPQCQVANYYYDQTIPNHMVVLTCDAGYAAYFFDNNNVWFLGYTTPNGNYFLEVPWDPATNSWYICEFCDDPAGCFVT